MIDSRIYTFMEVCRTLNYTRASANLHITQPAVTQHVQYLEQLYQVPLVEIRGKKVFLTEQGKILELPLCAQTSCIFGKRCSTVSARKKSWYLGRR